ncbi:hypothetical protein [Roseobacter sp. SK209-2-6]|nr:hypothetical protein [Roseobacter sp. SK209-2-6]
MIVSWAGFTMPDKAGRRMAGDLNLPPHTPTKARPSRDPINAV